MTISFDGNFTKEYSFCMIPDVNYTVALIKQSRAPWFGNVSVTYEDIVLLKPVGKPGGPQAIYVDILLPSSLIPTISPTPAPESTNYFAIILSLGFIVFACIEFVFYLKKRKNTSDRMIKSQVAIQRKREGRREKRSLVV